MAREIINLGNVANDGTGDSLRAAFRKVNNNFAEIYTAGFGGGNVDAAAIGSALVDGLPDGALLYREGANLGTVATNGNVWVSTTPDGSIYTSNDGDTWSPATTTPATLPNITRVVVIDVGTAPTTVATFVAIGAAGSILTSVNGLTWTEVSTPTSETLRDIHHAVGCVCSPGSGDVSVVVVGDAGTILTSHDLLNWTQRTSGTTRDLYGVTHDEAAGWVAVGDGDAIVTSATGTTWTIVDPVDVQLTEDLRDVVFSNNATNANYVIVGLGGVVYTSPDSADWSERISGVTADLMSVAANDAGVLVAVGHSLNAGVTIIRSSDGGVTWTVQTAAGVSSNLNEVSWTGSEWIAVGTNSTLLRSDDGITWTSTRLPGKLGASSDLVFDPITSTLNLGNIANVNLGTVSNIHITGGNAGQVLSTDGTGNLVWTNGPGNIAAGGPNGSMQFNNSGTLDGADGVSYDPVTDTLIVDNLEVGNLDLSTASNVTLPCPPYLHIGGGYSNQVLTTDGTGNLYWTNKQTNSTLIAGGINGQVQFNRNGMLGGEPQFRWDSATASLRITGNIEVTTGSLSGNGGRLTNIPGANVVGAVPQSTTAATVTANAQGNITSLGRLEGLVMKPIDGSGVLPPVTVESGHAYFGLANTVHIAGGFANHVLSTDGGGNLSWRAPATGTVTVTLRDGTTATLTVTPN